MIVDSPIRHALTLLFVVSLLCLSGRTQGDGITGAGPSSADADWAQFRGPARSGVSNAVALRRSWPEGGPPVLWRRELGEGFSGISVAGDHLYTLYAVDDREFAGCFRIADGSQVWRVDIGKEYLDEWGNGPRATPTIDGDVVFVVGTEGRLLALDIADGAIRWEVNLVKTFGQSRGRFNMAGMVPEYEETNTAEFGYCSSPLVVDDLLIVYTGAGDGKSLAALDKQTGEVRWTVFDNGSAHSSPALVEIEGSRQIVQIMPQTIAAVGPSGEVLWRFPWTQFNISQPVFVPPNMLFASTGNDVGAVLFEVTRKDDKLAVQTRWTMRQMRNSWGSSVFYKDFIYGFDNATLRCVEAASAETRWAKRGLGKGSLIIADGLLVVLSDQGVLALADATPEEYRELARINVLEGPTWTAPAIARGKLLLRNHKEMVCVDLGVE